MKFIKQILTFVIEITTIYYNALLLLAYKLAENKHLHQYKQTNIYLQLKFRIYFCVKIG